MPKNVLLRANTQSIDTLHDYMTIRSHQCPTSSMYNSKSHASMHYMNTCPLCIYQTWVCKIVNITLKHTRHWHTIWIHDLKVMHTPKNGCVMCLGFTYMHTHNLNLKLNKFLGKWMQFSQKKKKKTMQINFYTSSTNLQSPH